MPGMLVRPRSPQGANEAFVADRGIVKMNLMVQIIDAD